MNPQEPTPVVDNAQNTAPAQNAVPVAPVSPVNKVMGTINTAEKAVGVAAGLTAAITTATGLFSKFFPPKK